MTKSNAKKAGPPPKPDRDHAQSRKKITRRVKESAYEYYESELTKGKPREQILERLGKQYSRSSREIERWISEIRETKNLEQNIKEARQQHWNELADTAAKAAVGFYLRLVADFDYMPVSVRKALKEALKDSKAPNNGRKGEKPSPGATLPSFAHMTLEVLHSLEPFEWKKSAAHRLGLAERNRNLITHLDYDFKGFKDKLEDWKRYALDYQRWKIAGDEVELPYKPSEIKARLQTLTSEIIEVLNIAAERRTFKGMCEVCKNW